MQEDLTKLDIKEILKQLEDGYDIIKNNFYNEEDTFLDWGNKLFEENTCFPFIDLPLNLKDFLLKIKEK